ncbi:ParA family protein [Streptomyces kaniharaensis]|uniref:ParA family protein n=1 Tax=Streptomyces kaniharaensis TaxID=212423 RepID=A0A6N7L1D1_9ACTN|nr:plasmid partition protein [Streptomyces kaniharaensis]MQS17550.1 ParA family protein [Streptomyces kaniharaensis]
MLIANVSPRTGGKTTDSGLLAHAVKETKTKKAPQGRKVKGFDADHSQQFWQWAQNGDFSFPVDKLATARFHKEYVLPEDVVGIVDCGHSENHPDITDSVLRVADLVILHMAPTAGDFERIVEPVDKTTLADMIKRSASLRADGQAPPAVVLLNRTVPNTKSSKNYRTEMEAEGWDVLSTTIPRSEAFAQAVGFPVIGASKGPFGALVLELESRGLLT